MRKIPLDIDEPLNPGDEIDLHFKTFDATWIKATQAAMIESALENREGYEIIRINYQEPQKVIITCRIEKVNPVMLTAALIITAILSVGGGALAFGWMFEKAEKVVWPAAVGTVAIALVILLLLLLRK